MEDPVTFHFKTHMYLSGLSDTTLSKSDVTLLKSIAA